MSGDGQAREVLDHADGLLTAQGVTHEALMGVDLVAGACDVPALLVGGDQSERGGLLGVEQGGNQAVRVARCVSP